MQSLLSALKSKTLDTCSRNVHARFPHQFFVPMHAF